MSGWDALPTSVTVGGREMEIRSDYRVMLDICTALNDAELKEEERGAAVLVMFYPEWESIRQEHYQEAIQKCFWFLNGGQTETSRRAGPKLVDWAKDFPFIVAPINRVVGKEVRSVQYMHWWSFLSAYYEIGDCTFAQIVRIRSLRAQGKKMDAGDREWYRKNRELVDIQTQYTREENEQVSAWM